MKQTNWKIYMHYTVYLYYIFYLRTRAQSVRRQHRKRTSEKSDIVTYKDSTQVVSIRQVIQHAKKGDWGAILILIVVNVTLVGAFGICIIK